MLGEQYWITYPYIAVSSSCFPFETSTRDRLWVMPFWFVSILRLIFFIFMPVMCSFQVAHCFPDQMKDFPQELKDVLQRHSTTLDRTMRMVSTIVLCYDMLLILWYQYSINCFLLYSTFYVQHKFFISFNFVSAS